MPSLTPDLVRLLNLLGVGALSVSGTLAAGRKSLDLIGVIAIATVTAIGGGTVRDTLLGELPVTWVRDPVPLDVAVGTALVTVLVVRVWRPPERLLLITDALGLGVFAITGAQVAEQSGYGGLIAVVMGTLTGTAGGAVRDVLTGEVPLVLHGRELYASAAIAGIAIYLVLAALGVARDAAALAGIALVIALRFGAIFFGLRVPAFHHH